jgi:XPB/Ssl2-like helicase family protein
VDWPKGGLARWLRGRPDRELIALLDRRPDVTAARSFEDLASRLSTPWSVRIALDLADTAMLQLLEVLQALGDGVDAERVEALLGRPPGAPLDRLMRLGLVWPQGDGRLRIAGPLRRQANSPLGLGGLVAELLPAGQLPIGVALAIRGPGYHPPLDPGPPFIAVTTVHREHIEAGSRAAALSTIDGARRLVELLGRSPLMTVRAGGVGTRELAKAAKAIGATETELRLWLETLAAAGLVAVHGAQVMPTLAVDAWLAAEPAAALVTLLRAWWTLDRLPTHYRDEAGKAMPAFTLARPSAAALRSDLLRTLDELNTGGAGNWPTAGAGFCDLDALTERLAWLRPRLYGNAARARPLVTATVAESELLGLVAERALTPLGRALHKRDAGALRSAAAGLLPAPATTAIFLPDLTALVSGAPDTELAALLSSAADQEYSDTASAWRFSPSSVRRAFDAGHTADELVTALSAVAERPLPQPLVYLIRDVARRHGRLRVATVGCCVVADDPALAAEIASHTQLSALGLRLLGGTVLVSAEPAPVVLAALRATGYAPAQQDASGATVVERLQPQRAPAAAGPLTVKSLSLPDIVSRLRAARPPTRSAAFSEVAAHAQLSPAEQRLLAHAIERHEPVLIEYISAGGTRTTRIIEPEHLNPPMLVAWCQLRDAERHFLLSSITSVAPVP